MIFGRRTMREAAEAQARRRGYSAIVWQQLRRSRLARLSLYALCVLLFTAVFADILSNDKPLFCRLEGHARFPVFKELAVQRGWAAWSSAEVEADWYSLPYEAVVWPLVPYKYATIDRKNMGYVSPLAKQKVRSHRFWHWLGTDQSGRDVLAGLISGARTAILVGIVAMSIAAFIGILLGTLAGYFGDRGLRMSRARVLGLVLGLVLGVFYGFVARPHALSQSGGAALLKGLGILVLAVAVLQVLAGLLERLPVLGRRILLPIDLLVMRLIEILTSIPGLLLLLAVLAIIRTPSILYVMAIIGCLAWTGIARFMRAELLRIRRLEYIEAAQALGYSQWRTVWRHAMPNALTPVFIALAFGMANAVLLEAYLSFLGIGMPPEMVSWGTMLNQARSATDAWWIAIFPGGAIFVTVTMFNVLGEVLGEALNPRG